MFLRGRSPNKEPGIRIIDQTSWPRREHFQLYSELFCPHVNICVQVDVSDLWARRGELGASPTVGLLYVISKAAQRVPELRQRIRGEQVVEHEVVHPSVTVLGDNDLFGLVTLTYDGTFAAFAGAAEKDLETAKRQASLNDFPSYIGGGAERDDLLSITILPWLAFTSFAITRTAKECVPLLAIGKVQQLGDRWQLPFFVNFHHALADGLHIARFVKLIEEEASALAQQAAG